MKKTAWRSGFRAILAGIALLSLFILSGSQVARASDAGRYRESSDLVEMNLEELMSLEVYGASKFQQKMSEAPSSVTVITADEIKKSGYRTVADILKGVRSFYITYDRNYPFVGVRGFGRTGDYNTRFLVLVDGHRINENLYDLVLVGTEFIIDVDLIDRVEVIRGPSSSLYGDNAFFAVISIFTRKGGDIRGTEMSAEAGSFETYKTRLSYGNRFQNGGEMMLSGSYLGSQGHDRLFFKEFDDPATNNGIAEDNDFTRNGSFFARTSAGDFTFEGAYDSQVKGIPTASFGTDFNNSGNRAYDKRGYAELKYDHALPGHSGISARLYYDWYYYEGNYIYSGVLNEDFGRSKWWGMEAQIKKDFQQKHRLIAGAEYQGNLELLQRNYDESPYTQYYDDITRSDKWGLFVQDEYTLLPRLILNAGIRYDQYSTFGGTTNPRLAVIASPGEKTTVKLLYGQAYRGPNNYELYFNSPAYGLKGNPTLQPESIKTYELVVEQFIGDRLRLTAAGFYNKIENLISQVADPADGLLVYQNISEASTEGLEFELEHKGEKGGSRRVSYAIQEARDRSTGERMENSPRHLAKINLIEPLVREKLFAGVDVQYVGPRKTVKGSVAGGFVIANVTLFSLRMIRDMEVSGTVYNVFDKSYGDPGSTEHVQDIIEQDGRTYRVKLTYRF